jgi:tRNA dimethylallyltransferase
MSIELSFSLFKFNIMREKIIVICGPTGVGKTGMAIALARRFDGEIVSADSMQVFRHMTIGTAKPDEQELAMAHHHLVDVADPDQAFDAAQYQILADAAIRSILSRGRLPIVAGGTGLYIRALLHGLFRGRAADPAVIARFEALGREQGGAALHRMLADRDPDAAARLHPNDSFRVVRALEVLETTGRTISSLQQDHGFSKMNYLPLKLGLFLDRPTLYARIDQRVDRMMAQGLVEEVKQLLGMGYSCDLKSMQSIGYRHVCDFLNKGVSWQETLRLMKRDTRRYAKRQFTWFGREEGIVWIEPGDLDRAGDLVDRFLSDKGPRSLPPSVGGTDDATDCPRAQEED